MGANSIGRDFSPGIAVCRRIGALAPAICLWSMPVETYALTTVAYQRRRVFQTTASADLMIATLFRYRDESRFLLHGFAIMPEHVHVLVTPADTIERTAQLIKGGYSFAVRKQFRGAVWQPGYHAHRITSPEDYQNQLAYIARNPGDRRIMDYPYVHTHFRGRVDPPPPHCVRGREACPRG